VDGEVKPQGLEEQFKWQMAKFKWFAICHFKNPKPFALCPLPFAI